MKKFLINLISIGCILFVLSLEYYFLCKKTLNKYGMSTAKQIQLQYKNLYTVKDSVTTIVFGNSRLYRGINPYKLSGYAYNMSHDNDTYNQIYYKIVQAIAECPNLHTIIIGYDFFQFSFLSDTRNYVYCQYLPDEYLKDYSFSFIPISVQPYMHFVRNNKSYFDQFLKALLNKESKARLSARGQYTYESKATPNDTVNRNSNILPVQDYYFNKITSLLGNTKYDVFFVTMPIRDNEYNCYTIETIDCFREKIEKICSSYKNIKYIDESRNKNFIDYKLYTDITHFNSQTADIYTQHLDSIINKTLFARK